jgi:hypothetical protein
LDLGFIFVGNFSLCQCIKLYGYGGMGVQFVPRSKHPVSVIKASQLMLYMEIIAVCSEIHTKHINTLCGQHVEFFIVEAGGMYSNQYTPTTSAPRK